MTGPQSTLCHFSAECPVPFFEIWRREDLEQAVSSLTRACQARWCSLAVVFVLWQWGLRNRGETFYSIVDKQWPALVKTMQMMGLPISTEPVSAAALCKARQGIGTVAFEELYRIANRRHLERHHELTLYKGYRLYAVDGSNVTLHSNKKLAAAYGRPSSTGKRKSAPQASFTILELVNTGWIVNYRLGRCDASELSQAKSLSNSLGEGDLLLADRLYFDPTWYADLCQRQVKFLFRLNCNRHQSFTPQSQQRIKEQRTEGNVDCPVDLRVRTGKGSYTLLKNLRYIEIKRPGVETLYFITNLGPHEITTLEVAELYRMRWEIEINLRYFKGQDHLPIVRSKRQDTVRQEILLHVLGHNSVRFIQAEACQSQKQQESSDADDQQHQHSLTTPIKPAGKWTAKTKLCPGSLRPIDLQFTRTVEVVLGAIYTALLFPGNTTPARWAGLLVKIASLKIMAKPGRSFPRIGRKYNKGKPNKGNVKAQRKRAAARRKQKSKQKSKRES
jgi:hypothetical protein